jgi:molecular chaperone GrpE (heat shock protein)
MEMRDIETLAAEAAETAERTLRGPRPEAPEKRERILNKLDEVNRRIAGSAVKDAAGFLFPSVSELEAELKTPESDSFGRHLELSAKLYRALADAANYNRTCLEKQAEYKKRRCAWTSMRAPS